MFNQHGRGPLIVALLVSGAVFLPPGVAEAAPPTDGVGSAAACPAGGDRASGGPDGSPPSTGERGSAGGGDGSGRGGSGDGDSDDDPDEEEPDEKESDEDSDEKESDEKESDEKESDENGSDEDSDGASDGPRGAAWFAAATTVPAGTGKSAATGTATVTATITPTADPSAVPAPPAPSATSTAGATVTTTATARPSAAVTDTATARGSAGATDSATRSSATAEPTSRAAAPADRPGDLLDLGPWKLTLPSGRPGRPDEIDNPELATFSNDSFALTPGRDGVAFRAGAGGVTTPNSKYPRSELREMNGAEEAAWSNTSGTHTLDVCEAFTKLPSVKPHVVGVQIHDGDDDVLQVRLEGEKLSVQYEDGDSEAVLDPAYRLGTPFRVRVVAANSTVEVFYNGESKADLPLSGSGWYWKVGAYVQSNAEKGDTGEGATGEVVVYSIDREHA